MIVLIIELILLIPSLIFDFYIGKKTKKDESVSEHIYRYVHREPIVALVAGGLVISLLLEGLMTPLEAVVSGILIGHLTWKA